MEPSSMKPSRWMQIGFQDPVVPQGFAESRRQPSKMLLLLLAKSLIGGKEAQSCLDCKLAKVKCMCSCKLEVTPLC